MRVLILFILISISAKAQFEMKPNSDLVIMPITVIGAAVGHSLTNNTDLPVLADYEQHSILDIPFFDKLNTEFRSTYADISDVLLGLQLISPLAYGFSDTYGDNLGTLGMMYYQTMSLNYGLNATTKAIIARSRPLSYSKNTTEDMLLDPDTKFSFYSGHSSSAYASAVFNSIMLSEMPQTTLRDIGIGLNLANATAIATLRVLAGKHFLSDVVIGAVIGSGIAYLITEVHRGETNSYIPHEFTPVRIGVSFGL